MADAIAHILMTPGPASISGQQSSLPKPEDFFPQRPRPGSWSFSKITVTNTFRRFSKPQNRLSTLSGK